MGSQMLLKKCAVDVGFVTETARHHVARVNPHVHTQSSECRVAPPTRVTDVGPIGFRDGADCLAMLIWMCFHSMLTKMAAFRKCLVANAAGEPLPGHCNARMILCHVFTQLHLVDKRASTQVTQVRFLANVPLVMSVQIGSL